MSASRYAIGLDLGGTKIAAGLMAADGTVLAECYRATPVAAGVAPVVDALVEAAREVVAQAGAPPEEIAGVGLGCPGPIDPEQGMVVFAPNLFWKDVPVTSLLTARLPWPCRLVNDADAAALGEAVFGAGQGAEFLLYLTVSTGIGGGIILRRRIYSGAHGMAGEFGHVVVDPGGPACRCGRKGCLEALASGPATARRAKEALARGRTSVLSALAGGEPERVTARLVGEAAAQGDQLAQEVLAETARYLGLGVVNLVNIFDPEQVVIGGGLANLGEALLGPVREAVRESALPPAGERVQVARAALGRLSGVVGAAAYVLTCAG
ncbi:MAG: ROK family protein [Chitinophagales bacterium]